MFVGNLPPYTETLHLVATGVKCIPTKYFSQLHQLALDPGTDILNVARKICPELGKAVTAEDLKRVAAKNRKIGQTLLAILQCIHASISNH